MYPVSQATSGREMASHARARVEGVCERIAGDEEEVVLLLLPPRRTAEGFVTSTSAAAAGGEVGAGVFEALRFDTRRFVGEGGGGDRRGTAVDEADRVWTIVFMHGTGKAISKG